MVSIRRIRSDEGPAFRAIRLQAIQDSPTAFGSTMAETEARPPSYWEHRAMNAAAGTENVLFIAEDTNRWVGIVGGFVDEAPGVPSVDLVSMWIHSAYRGHGLGRRLVEQIVAWARDLGAQRVVLWVTESNPSAIALYRRCGFKETGKAQPLPSHPDLSERQMVLDLS